MKNRFPSHFPQSPEALSVLWETCTFVLDSNVLLNLYRYSDKTTGQFFDVLMELQTRLWIPHQAGEEFFKNRLGAIMQESAKYAAPIKAIGKLNDELDKMEANSKHPHIETKALEEALAALCNLKKELSDQKSNLLRHATEDPIRDRISSILDGRVGAPYDEERLAALIEEGKERYSKDVPPGFKDKEKEGLSKYGDLLVWFQTLDFAEEHSKSVILVTDDSKADWWELLGEGQKVGPHKKLISEFSLRIKQPFHMYTPLKFMEIAEERTKKLVDKTTLAEIQKLSAEDSAVVAATEWPSRNQGAERPNTLIRNIHPDYAKQFQHNEASTANLIERRSKVSEAIFALTQRIDAMEQMSIKELGKDGLRELKHARDENDSFYGQLTFIKSKIKRLRSQRDVLGALNDDLSDRPREG